MDSTCKICGKSCKTLKGLVTSHLPAIHKISHKEYYDRFYKKEKEGFCLFCGEETSFSGTEGYFIYCSYKCSGLSLIRLSKYKKTNLLIYGKEYPTQSNIVQGKRKQTYIEKYGTFHISEIEEIKKKSRNTSLEKYGVENVSQLMRVRDMWRSKMLNGGSANANRYRRKVSKPQISLYKLVQQICPYSILNYPVYSPKNYSIDIAIPHLALALEYDESWYHQDKEADIKRQKDLEEQGWRFLRYRDHVPKLEQLNKDILQIVRVGDGYT